MRRVRILTFNIAHGRGLNPIQGTSSAVRLRRNLRRIGDLIIKLDVDVVALQEIDQHSRWAGNFDQLDYLSQHTGLPYSVFGVHNRREGLINLAYGNAILSRYPILASEVVSFGQSKVGEKGFIFAEIELHGMRLPVVNLHLHYRSKAHRFRQLDRLLEFLQEKRAAHGGEWPVLPIVCGDFNTPGRDGDVTAALDSHLQELGNYTRHPRRGRTFPSPLPARLLDFVFVPPRARDPHCHVVRSMLSDHRPVLVEFEVN
ncbi:endonuclease/exonuclease/phosphatase family protein [Synoicihabitans lomoniglobus]|uniref:Endonuclease/exonuclease/phosphatase family protein n=1 Tax=Synoicihabitans lomoniglobus TaxID=2909285 RepID=A0AAF0CSZ1_9BACT|nr:endonuclease/exonuclease/phosphatase family protein [Opitutaceae bacterium LMO-M01]